MIRWTLAAWIVGMILDVALFDGFLMLRVLLPLLVMGWHIRNELRETIKKKETPSEQGDTSESAPEVKEEA